DDPGAVGAGPGQARDLPHGVHEVDVRALVAVGEATGVVVGREAQAEVGGANTEVPLGEVVRGVPVRGGRGAVLAGLDRSEYEVQAAVGEDALLGEPGGRHLRVRVGARAPDGHRREVGQRLVRAAGVDAVGACTAHGPGLALHADPV